MGAGTPFESAYVYGNDNPMMFTDPSGMRGQLTGGLPAECFDMSVGQYARDSVQAGVNVPGSVANGYIWLGNLVNPFDDIPKIPKIRTGGACNAISDGATGAVTFVASGGAQAIMAAPKIVKGGASALKSGANLVRALQEERAAASALKTVEGLHAALSAAASGGGPTVRVFTNLDSAPAVGRGLSVALGESASNLAGAARSGRLFQADIPSALLTRLRLEGLAQSITVQMGGVVGQEIRFKPDAAQYVVNFFREAS